jgi:hypothetical protein
VTLAELEAADTADSETEETGNVLRIEDFRCSHLDGNRPPPICQARDTKN